MECTLGVFLLGGIGFGIQHRHESPRGVRHFWLRRELEGEGRSSRPQAQGHARAGREGLRARRLRQRAQRARSRAQGALNARSGDLEAQAEGSCLPAARHRLRSRGAPDR